MSEKYTLEQVADIACSEGLDYAITDYMSGEDIEDEVLATMWNDAKEAVNNIQRYIEFEMRKIDPEWEWE